jgi:hypothetical protein
MISGKRFVIPAVLCLFLIAVILTGMFGSNPAPHFVPVQTQPTGPFRAMHYNWHDVAPVQSGRVWFWTVPATTNVRTRHFLYDLKSSRVIGELLNGAPLFSNSDQTKLLCEDYSATESLKWKLIQWLGKFSFGNGLRGKLNYQQAFWVLDLRNNSAVRVGKVTQAVGSGSSFIPSPGFRFGYNEPSTARNGELFLCDLESNVFTKIKIDGEPLGWWDGENILFKDKSDNFSLFDVTTHTARTAFAATVIATRLRELGLPDDPLPLGITAFCHWNGHDNDILFTEYKAKNSGRSFLLKADRKDLTLKLLYKEFQFQWLGHLDADCTHYLYEGESGKPGQGGNGAVYLRNLLNDATMTLVEPDNRGQYSLASFWDDGVVYSRNRLLWRVDLNGSNNVPLIPESSK